MVARILRVSLLNLVLFSSLMIASAENNLQHTWSGVKKIVAVGDIHGDYNKLVQSLRLGGVIDKENKWIGGETHLVQTGDLLDRGPHTIKVMELLMTLEKEAAAAGGMVHNLIGNHEAMRIGGQSRQGKDVSDVELKTYGGMAEMKKAFGSDGKYGAWIRSHNAVIKINDTLFVHGGLSPKHATMSLNDLNQAVRKGLKSDRPHGLARDSSGPLWYRGLADEKKLPDAAATELMDVISKNYGVKRVVVGHSVQHTISTRVDGRIIMIDVGMVFGREATCLVVEGKNVFTVTEKGKTPLPSVSKAAKKSDR